MHRCVIDFVSRTQQSQCLFAVHGFIQGVYKVHEGDTLATGFALNVVGTTDFPAGLFVSGVITAEASGTASEYCLLQCLHLCNY